MEWALHVKAVKQIQETKDLNLAGGEPGSDWPGLTDPVQAESRRVIEELFGKITVSRIYFGNEFCQRLLPSPSLLARVYSAASDRDLAFTFLSPYVTDDGIDQLTPLFSFLDGCASRTEVVVNDWGVLRLLRRDFPNLAPVLGRLLNKTLRDPLAASFYCFHPLTPREALSALGRSNLSIPVYQTFLHRSGIRLVELDNLVQGMDMSFKGLAGALYVPYGFVATGRICLFASLNQPKERKFTVSTTCSKECQRHYAECRYDAPPFKGNAFVLLHRGNTVFYSQSRDLLRSALVEAEAKGIQRIVYQPQIPL